MVKKQHRICYFQRRCWFYKFPGMVGIPIVSRGTFLLLLSISRNKYFRIALRLLKARESRDLDKYHASNTHLRALQIVSHTHTQIHPLRKVDRFLVSPKTFKLTSSILRQFCVCVAHSTSLIADLFKVLRNRWKHYFNFPSLIYHDEVFKSRSGFEIAICLISAKCLLWSQALIEEYLKNVHRHFRLIIFRDHRCKHF